MSKKLFLFASSIVVLFIAVTVIPGTTKSFRGDIFGEVKREESKNNNLLEETQSFFKNVGRVAGETTTKYVEAGETFIKKGVAEGTKSVTNKIQEKIEETALGILNNVEEGIRGTKTEAIGIDDAPPVSYIVRQGTLTSFNIKKLPIHFSTFDLKVDWGDGTREERKNLSNNDNQTISHGWNGVGTYNFQFKVISSGVIKIYDGSITVIK